MNKYRFTHLPGASLYFLYYLTEKCFGFFFSKFSNMISTGFWNSLSSYRTSMAPMKSIKAAIFFSSLSTVFRSDCAKTNKKFRA